MKNLILITLFATFTANAISLGEPELTEKGIAERQEQAAQYGVCLTFATAARYNPDRLTMFEGGVQVWSSKSPELQDIISRTRDYASGYIAGYMKAMSEPAMTHEAAAWLLFDDANCEETIDLFN